MTSPAATPPGDNASDGMLGPPYVGCRGGFHEDVCTDGIWLCAVRRFGIPDEPQEQPHAPATGPDTTAIVCVRLARCENYLEREDRPCTGLLAFQPGDRQAACSRCQAWCGVQVADYTTTITAGLTATPPAPDPGTTEIPADVAETLLRALVWCGDQVTHPQRNEAWAWIERHREQVEEMGQ